MLLNGGELHGARVLKAGTVALMGQNHIGAVSVPAQKSQLPRSRDFSFIADGRDKWGLGFGHQRLSYSSWRCHQGPFSLRPLGARSSQWYTPKNGSTPRA